MPTSFGKLPPELQFMIWKEAFYATASKQRVIEDYVKIDITAKKNAQDNWNVHSCCLGYRFYRGDRPFTQSETLHP